MQTDMHYYATYALARAAGFRVDVARAIATCCEYVDHSAGANVVCKDGFRIRTGPTSHHPAADIEYTTPHDQRRTWVPFHFIPGNRGETLDEKLLCVMDGPIARAVVDHALNHLDREFAIPLLGILAHAYGDTFAHYGFSGISSKLNRVHSASITLRCSDASRRALVARYDRFLARYATGRMAAYLRQLGHGSVANLPDEPFLNWEFVYASPVRPAGVRDNPATFLIGCQRLHDVFARARSKFRGAYDDVGAYRDFAGIQGAIREILSAEGDVDARAGAWKSAAASGRLYRGGEPIPDYDARMLTADLRAFARYDRTRVTQTLAYRFLQAADFHRDALLDTLLPQHGIHLDSAPIEWDG